ncbi:hypothetical protein OG742_37045 [Streptomyces sp. NBC_00828]|uniref:hypothetical protein n=1 Tax=Streptomyces sp. NBC_00828 TaxID=2903678 RepID=UPI003869AC46
MSRSRPPLSEFAQAAYAAYGAATGHRTYDDRPMAEWEDLGEQIQAAWVCAAGAVSLSTLATLGAVDHDGSPDVGDIVLVPVDPAESNGARVAPAVITRVWNKTTVNARVLHDSDAVRWRTSLTFVDSLDNAMAGAAVWTWPTS